MIFPVSTFPSPRSVEGLLKTSLLQPSCVGSAECLQAASGDWDNLISGGRGTEQSH